MSWVNDILKSLMNSSEMKDRCWTEPFEPQINEAEIDYRREELLDFTRDLIDQEVWFVNRYQLATMNTPQSQGLVLKSKDPKDLAFFSLYNTFVIYELKKLGLYYVTQKEVKCQQSLTLLAKNHCIYLKPYFIFESAKRNQSFGNLSLSLLVQNNHQYSYKIQANYYEGINYTTPKRMVDLLKLLLGRP
jgi:hypothetical protein